MWPRWVALNSVEWASRRVCSGPLTLLEGSGLRADAAAVAAAGQLSCSTPESRAACAALGSGFQCTTERDGYLFMVLASSCFAAAWWIVMRGRVAALQAAPRAAWLTG